MNAQEHLLEIVGASIPTRQKRELLVNLCKQTTALEVDEAVSLLETAVNLLTAVKNETVHELAELVIESIALFDTQVFVGYFKPFSPTPENLLQTEQCISCLRVLRCVTRSIAKLTRRSTEESIFVFAASVYGNFQGLMLRILKVCDLPDEDELRMITVKFLLDFAVIRPPGSQLLPHLVLYLNEVFKMEQQSLAHDIVKLVDDLLKEDASLAKTLLLKVFHALASPNRCGKLLSSLVSFFPQNLLPEVNPFIAECSTYSDGADVLKRVLERLLDWLLMPTSTGIGFWIVKIVRAMAVHGHVKTIFSLVTPQRITKITKLFSVAIKDEIQQLSGSVALDELRFERFSSQMEDDLVETGDHRKDIALSLMCLLLGNGSSKLLPAALAIIPIAYELLVWCQQQLSKPLVLGGFLSSSFVSPFTSPTAELHQRASLARSQLLGYLNQILYGLFRLHKTPFFEAASNVFYLLESLGINSPTGAETNQTLNTYAWQPSLPPPLQTNRGMLVPEPASSKEHNKLGLVNLGNTCFMNSILQALFATVAFREVVFRCRPKRSEILAGLQSVFAFLALSTRPYVRPIKLLQTLPDWLRTGYQQDSMEFLHALFDDIEKDLSSKGKFNDANPDKQLDTNQLNKVFGGLLSRRIVCAAHHYSSSTEAFVELTAYFTKTKSETAVPLDRLLLSYFEPEKLRDENKYFCDSCRCYCDADKVTGIDQAPQHLIINLGRFEYNKSTQIKQKIMTPVILPPVLKLMTVQAQTGVPGTVAYLPYALIIHSGRSADHGHYYCYARSSEDEEGQVSSWWLYNDDNVTMAGSWDAVLADLEQLPADTPYIMFYQKQTAPKTTNVSPELLPSALVEEVRMDNLAHRRERSSRTAVTLPQDSYNGSSGGGGGYSSGYRGQDPSQGNGGGGGGFDAPRYIY